MAKNKERKRREIDLKEHSEILEATKTRSLTEQEYAKLEFAYEVLTDLLDANRPKSPNEKNKNVLPGHSNPDAEMETPQQQKKTRGKGKTNADFPTSETIIVGHQELQPGSPCPCCELRKLRGINRKSNFRFFEARPPITVTFYEREMLRCDDCNKDFPAPLPAGVGPDPYAPSAVALIVLLKYGFGLPYYRQESLFKCLSTPIAVSTQYELAADAEYRLRPLYNRLLHWAAQGQLAYFDDTSMKILRFERNNKDSRTGLFTTGVVSESSDFKVALLFTGRNHAGENMKKLDDRREPDLPAMIRMSDALSRNFSELEDDDDVVACCMAHGRRNFVPLIDQFPEECRHLLESIGKVYHHDKLCKEGGMNDDERLEFHKAQSGPIMDSLKEWLLETKSKKVAEPNSKFGKAMQYLLNHWDGLTLFLRVAGAPLDNNTAERCLKKVVLHRKNSLFYRTIKGARVGDAMMSIIQTCQLNGLDAFHFLTQALENWQAVRAAPDHWLPWTYKATLANRPEPIRSTIVNGKI